MERWAQLARNVPFLTFERDERRKGRHMKRISGFVRGSLPGAMLLMLPLVLAQEPQGSDGAKAAGETTVRMKPVLKLEVEPSIEGVRAKIDELATEVGKSVYHLKPQHKSVEDAFEEMRLPLKRHREEIEGARRDFLDAMGAMEDTIWAPSHRGIDAETENHVRELRAYRDRVIAAFSAAELNTSELMTAGEPDAVDRRFVEHKFRMEELRKLLDEGPERIAATLEHFRPEGKVAAAPAPAREAPAVGRARTPKMVSVEDEAIAQLADEPTAHFKEADRAIRRKDPATAASELRKGSAFMRLEVHRADDVSIQLLHDSALELDRLAEGCEKGSPAEVEEFDAAFARAHYALASHHRAKAGKAFYNRDYREAGLELASAGRHTAQGMEWISRTMPKEARETIKSASDKLASGTDWAKDEVEDALEQSGKQIEKLGNWMQEKR